MGWRGLGGVGGWGAGQPSPVYDEAAYPPPAAAAGLADMQRHGRHTSCHRGRGSQVRKAHGGCCTGRRRRRSPWTRMPGCRMMPSAHTRCSCARVPEDDESMAPYDTDAASRRDCRPRRLWGGPGGGGGGFKHCDATMGDVLGHACMHWRVCGGVSGVGGAWHKLRVCRQTTPVAAWASSRGTSTRTTPPPAEVQRSSGRRAHRLRYMHMAPRQGDW